MDDITLDEWVEVVFWLASGVIKHGLFLKELEDITLLDRRLVSKLWAERSGLDELHCIREQLIVEYDLAAAHERLCPYPLPKVTRDYPNTSA